MTPIGGYFELADREECTCFPHSGGVLLNTGRNALEFILMSLAPVRKVYLPYYTCEVVLEPLKRLGITWEFYHINNQLELAESIQPGTGEYLILNNYLGVKDKYISKMASIYGEKLIVDCAQAFFAPVIDGIKCFYSARKFVGVSDGGVAYPFNNNIDISVLGKDDSTKHSEHLFIRKEKGAEAGFATYQADEELLNNNSLHRMSDFTADILMHIGYNAVIEKRRRNYSFLETTLNKSNLLSLPDSGSLICPMAYPYMVENGAELRKKLISNKVFVPCFWPNKYIPHAIVGGKDLSEAILPLPIDQRYGEEEMKKIVEVINR